MFKTIKHPRLSRWAPRPDAWMPVGVRCVLLLLKMGLLPRERRAYTVPLGLPEGPLQHTLVAQSGG